MAEFAANNHVNKLTRVTLFFIDNSRNRIELPLLYRNYSQRNRFLSADNIIVNKKNKLVLVRSTRVNFENSKKKINEFHKANHRSLDH